MANADILNRIDRGAFKNPGISHEELFRRLNALSESLWELATQSSGNLLTNANQSASPIVNNTPAKKLRVVFDLDGKTVFGMVEDIGYQLIATPSAVITVNNVTFQETTSLISGSGNVLTISNTTAGTTLNWVATIQNDTSGKMTLSSSSGTISGVGSTDITVGLSSDPGVGEYSATVHVSGIDATPADSTVTLTVVPDYTGALNDHNVGNYYLAPGWAETPFDEALTNLITYVSPGIWSNASGGTTKPHTKDFGYYTSEGTIDAWAGAGWYASQTFQGHYPPMYTGYTKWAKITVTLDSVTGKPSASISFAGNGPNVGPNGRAVFTSTIS